MLNITLMSQVHILQTNNPNSTYLELSTIIFYSEIYLAN